MIANNGLEYDQAVPMNTTGVLMDLGKRKDEARTKALQRIPDVRR